MFALTVRFDLKDEAAAQGFDVLTVETSQSIRALEPDTLVYATHTVEGEPLARIFYELYRDRDAFAAHEQQPHTRRFFAECDRYVSSTRIELLTPQTTKGIPAPLMQSPEEASTTEAAE